MKIDINKTKKEYEALSDKEKEQKRQEKRRLEKEFENSSIYKTIKQLENSFIYKTTKQFELIKPQLELYKKISKSILTKPISLQEVERLQKISKALSRNVNIKELKEYAIKIKKIQETMAHRIGQNENQNKLSISQPKLQLPRFTDFAETINKDMKVLIKNTKPFTFKDKVINIIINRGITTVTTIVISIVTVIIAFIICKLF